MSKTAKVLILLTSVALLLVLYLIFSSKLVVIDDEPGQSSSAPVQPVATEPVDLVLLAENYSTAVVQIWTDLETMIGGLTATSSTTSTETMATGSLPVVDADEIKPSQLKARLMDLTVPEERKDFHVSLVLALAQFEKYTESGDAADLDEGLRMLAELENPAVWENNL